MGGAKEGCGGVGEVIKVAMIARDCVVHVLVLPVYMFGRESCAILFCYVLGFVFSLLVALPRYVCLALH